LIGNKNYWIPILSDASRSPARLLARPSQPSPYLPFTGEVRTEMVEAAGYSGASDDYYEVNPTLDPENVAAGVRFMLSLPYKVQVRSAAARENFPFRLIRF
jgi:hypothetical protein